MILTQENIKEWKETLDETMLRLMKVPNYSLTLTDKEWLDLYEGDSVQQAVNEEISCWGDN